MMDSRFTTAFKDEKELLEGMDVDDIDDVETLLMFLLSRPVSVEMASEEGDGDIDPILVTVWGERLGRGTIHTFPMTVVDLALNGARLAVEVGPYDGRPSTVKVGSEVLGMSKDELGDALQRALGMVRLFNAREDE